MSFLQNSSAVASSPVVQNVADSKQRKLVAEWWATLNPDEQRLHELAQKMLKKSLNASADDKDNGSYYPFYCRAFQKWLGARQKAAQTC